MFEIEDDYTASQLKAKLWQFSWRIEKKLAFKHSIEKPVSLNLMNVYTIFSLRL